jgi:hypothetical protein
MAETDDFQPEQRDAETGVYTFGERGFPLAHLARAEAIAKAGLKHDPDGLVDDERIAEAVTRRKAEADAAKKATAPEKEGNA